MENFRVVTSADLGRRPGLDQLRVLATLLVVMLHAGVPYTIAPLPGLTWPVRHTATSSLVDALFWGIEGAIMPLFFLLSGYGAAQSLQAKPAQFLATRWRRLGWPLLAAAVVLLPTELYIWMLGWAADGQLSLRRLISVKLGPLHQDLWGLSHLWYLEYLLLYSGLFWAGQRLLAGRNFHRMTLLQYITINQRLFLVSTLVLWIAPEVIVGFQHGFVPVPAKFVFSGLFFAAGVAEFHRPTRGTVPVSTLAFAAGVTLISVLPLIHQQSASPLVGVERLVLAIGLTAYTLLVLQAAWQGALSVTRTTSPSVDYLTRASFWTYLVHHPLVAVWQIGLRPTGWPALVQFALCTLGTVAMCLISYEVLVRRTWLGGFLEGRAVSAMPLATVPSEIPSRRAA